MSTARSRSGACRALWPVLCSALLAALALGGALWWTRPSTDAALHSERFAGSTPEQAAERFLEAYRSGAFKRASRLAVGGLAKALAARPRQPERAANAEREAFVVEESHRLDSQRLRLSGLLVREGQPEADAQGVTLLLSKQDGRYLVEEVTW